MATLVPAWQAATQYQQGATVLARTGTVVTQEQPTNPSFETGGLANWTVTGRFCTNAAAIAATSISTAQAYNGTHSVTMSNIAGDGSAGDPQTPNGNFAAFALVTNNLQVPVVPGQVINFKARAWINPVDNNQAFTSPSAEIVWYDNTHTEMGFKSVSTPIPGPPLSNWFTMVGKGVAPAGAAFAAARITLTTTIYASQRIYIDDYTWDYTTQVSTAGLVFVATQSGLGTSGATEPVWPVTAGLTVVDGSVTWTAEVISTVTWQAESILFSGTVQPTFPTSIGAVVNDNRVEWTATDGRITDTNCPNSKIVAIASAKVFAADNDIIRFSATANAQDWTSTQDAGFIPFGLQTYGNDPIQALGLYRSNLVAFNSLGYQMWQIDPDPNNIAILDAEPVGCNFAKSVQPVNNDLVFLSPVGIRNIGTAGASGNLQAGQFGKQVDPLVKALILKAAALGVEVKALFYPGAGQYWLIFGTDVMVLSINGNNTMSWSRYSFPGVITDWAINGALLYLRSGDLVWVVSEAALNDDEDQGGGQGGTNTGFQGYVSWNYLECGEIGDDKQMEGLDLTIGRIDNDGTVVDTNTVSCNISIGYNQSNLEMATDPFTVTGDSIPGTMIPMPITAPSFQLRLDFTTGQNWGWGAASLYVTPLRKP